MKISALLGNYLTQTDVKISSLVLSDTVNKLKEIKSYYQVLKQNDVKYDIIEQMLCKTFNEK